MRARPEAGHGAGRAPDLYGEQRDATPARRHAAFTAFTQRSDQRLKRLGPRPATLPGIHLRLRGLAAEDIAILARETRPGPNMALAARGTERYELAATIVNALAHHQSAVDPDVAMRHVTAIVANGSGDTSQSGAWLGGHIDRITTELNPI